MKKFISALLTLILMTYIITPIPAKAASSEYYELTPEDEKWNTLTLEEKRKTCELSETELNSLSDQELIEAISEYPFLIDVYAFDNFQLAIDHMENTCDAYRELITRKSGAESFYNALSKRTKESLTLNEKICDEELAILLLYQPQFTKSLSPRQLDEINNNTNTEEYYGTPEYVKSSGITTPKGTAVSAIQPKCNHSTSWHDAQDKEIVNTYNVTKISRGTCKYNCHSYAWYSQSTSNTYWINNPSPYMTDGSYKKMLSGLGASSINAKSGDRVFWGTNSSPIHSAIIRSSATGAPLATRFVYSKWGKLGVFRHTVSNSPYNTANISVWHR
mgnify:CR=1 FL=1